MTQETTYKRSIAGSVGAGVRSVVGGKGSRFYILEHKVSSKYHKAGESQRIIIDQIEIGRDPRCQVRFDEQFSTVSRRHAAIVRDGDNWKLIQLSRTNSTFLNGRRVENEWYLQNGDEIQLSTDGPRLGFIIPAGDKSLVKNIGMTARLNLFRQQALRPYKTAIIVLACILILACAGGGYHLYELFKENKEQAELIALNEKRHAEEMAVRDSLLNAAQNNVRSLTTELGSLKKRFKEVSDQQRSIAVATGAIDNNSINSCLSNVFFLCSVSIDVVLPNGESGTLDCADPDAPCWSGTGFLLDDGRFVTARHVIEPWSYCYYGGSLDEDWAQLNLISNNGGSVKAHFVAISSSGKRFNLTSDQFRCDRSADEISYLEEGYKISLASGGDNDYAYAYANVGQGVGLNYDKKVSENLERGTKLTILGFPLGFGVNSTSINPIYGSGIVSVDGLQYGMILTTDTNYEQGCSGAPAFYTDGTGNLVVVGIVSAFVGNTTGYIIPISKIN